MNDVVKHTLALLALLLYSIWSYAAQDIDGRVVYVDDGDTVVLLVGGREQLKVRLASIDAPESAHVNRQKGRIGQAYSQNSKALMEHLVKGRDVVARCYERDRYARVVCDLSVNGTWVNAEMVRQGLAWANQSAGGRYLRDKRLIDLESQAREEGVGLWRDRNPVPPWEWRKRCWEQGQC